MPRGASRALTAIAIGAIVAGTAAFRVLSFDRFQNDQFVHLTRAYQMTLGERPFRDFDDPGLPAHVMISALGLSVAERSLLPELLISAVAFGAAAAMSWLAAVRLTGFPWVAWLAAALQVAAYPRLYSYPKLLVHACAALAIVCYARQPTRARLAWLAAVAVIGGLFRYDHAAYALIAAAATVLLLEGRRAASSLLFLALIASAFAVPLVAYMQVNEGVADALSLAMRFSAAEARRTGGVMWPLLMAVVLPLATAAALRQRVGTPQGSAVVAIALLTGLLCGTMLRDRVLVRLPDVYAPASILFAWAVCELWNRGPAIAGRAAALALAAVAALGTVQIGDAVHELFETRVLAGPRPMLAHARQLGTNLRYPWTAVMPDERLAPVVRAIERCTSPNDRIAVVGFAPELPFLAQRGFTGRQPSLLPGYLDAPDDRARLERSLVRSPPAIVIVEHQEAEALAADLPPMANLLRQYHRGRSIEAGPVTFDFWTRTSGSCE